jgi:DNA-binding transcriptional regulator YdaS (Cro superfamily)
MHLKEYTDRHTQIALARSIKAAPSFVNQWVNQARPVPVGYCVAIEQATNGEVTRRDLRPNDFWLIWPDLAAPTTANMAPAQKDAAEPEPNTPRERRDPAIADRRVSERSVADRRASVAAEPVQRA